MASAISEEEVSQVVNSMKMVMAGVDLLDEKIHNPFREILAPLEELGHVLAWKAMGAGGGGVIGVIIDNDEKSKAAILDAMQTAEWPQILWQIEDSGITLQ
jgi:galactokinase/mevalonate kinase-like predicted kinase